MQIAKGASVIFKHVLTALMSMLGSDTDGVVFDEM